MTHTEDIKRLRKSLLNSEDFECWLINVLDSEDLTHTEKIKLIRTRI